MISAAGLMEGAGAHLLLSSADLATFVHLEMRPSFLVVPWQRSAPQPPPNYLNEDCALALLFGVCIMYECGVTGSHSLIKTKSCLCAVGRLQKHIASYPLLTANPVVKCVFGLSKKYFDRSTVTLLRMLICQ